MWKSFVLTQAVAHQDKLLHPLISSVTIAVQSISFIFPITAVAPSPRSIYYEIQRRTTLHILSFHYGPGNPLQRTSLHQGSRRDDFHAEICSLRICFVVLQNRRQRHSC